MDEQSDCTPCKLISGFGFLGFGLYVGIVGTKNSRGPYSRFAVALIGVVYTLANFLGHEIYKMLADHYINGPGEGFAGVGIARLFGLPPFSKKKKIEPTEKI